MQGHLYNCLVDVLRLALLVVLAFRLSVMMQAPRRMCTSDLRPRIVDGCTSMPHRLPIYLLSHALYRYLRLCGRYALHTCAFVRSTHTNSQPVITNTECANKTIY